MFTVLTHRKLLTGQTIGLNTGHNRLLCNDDGSIIPRGPASTLNDECVSLSMSARPSYRYVTGLPENDDILFHFRICRQLTSVSSCPGTKFEDGEASSSPVGIA